MTREFTSEELRLFNDIQELLPAADIPTVCAIMLVVKQLNKPYDWAKVDVLKRAITEAQELVPPATKVLFEASARS